MHGLLAKARHAEQHDGRDEDPDTDEPPRNDARSIVVIQSFGAMATGKTRARMTSADAAAESPTMLLRVTAMILNAAMNIRPSSTKKMTVTGLSVHAPRICATMSG